METLVCRLNERALIYLGAAVIGLLLAFAFSFGAGR